MNYKTVFFDKNFWNFIYRPVFACISLGITISASLIIVLWLTQSLIDLKDALQSVMGLIIFFSVFLGTLGNVGILAISLKTVKTYIFLIPVDEKSSLSDTMNYLSKKWDTELFASFRLPLGLFIVSIIAFFAIPQKSLGQRVWR